MTIQYKGTRIKIDITPIGKNWIEKIKRVKIGRFQKPDTKVAFVASLMSAVKINIGFAGLGMLMLSGDVELSAILDKI